MKHKYAVWCGVVLTLLVPVMVQAQYAARVTVTGGNSFVVKKLNIQGDRLYTDAGRAASSVSMVKAVEFRFQGINEKICRDLFRAGDLKALESLLEQHVGPVKQYNFLPGNLGDYLVWMLRVQFWNGNYSEAVQTIDLLRGTTDPNAQRAADLYYALVLLEQDRLDDAKTVFRGVADPETFSRPMTEYIRGRVALAEADYRQAMLHAAEIIAFHSSEVEWMPPATVLEARIYQRTGQVKKAGIVADELIMAYPGSQWSRQGEKIKQESMGTSGG